VFDWKSDYRNAFDQLRDCLLCEPVLKHHDPSRPTKIETQSSGYAVGAVLNQEHTDGWRPVPYLSMTMTSAERNYPIQGQELLEPRSMLLYFIREGIRTYPVGIHEVHDVRFAAHPGFTKVYEDIRKLVYWPKMRIDIEKYIKTCHRCQFNKPYRQVTSVPLQLMPIPNSPRQSISLDFITILPKTNVYDSILEVVCYLFKIAHFITTETVSDAVKDAELFIENIFKLHGLAKNIISDRDPKFTSKFWKSLFKTLETELRFSTAFHPETDGQTERLNQTLEIMLRHYVEDDLNTWTKYLHILGSVYSSATHYVIGKSTFSLVYRRKPDSPISIALSTAESQVDATATLLKSLHATWADAKDCFSFAQARQTKYQNKCRKSRDFNSKDLVF